ncbi:MAG: PD40 domain-containing protein [Bacteroidales bacterium]|nr:PD40 domain-containing protein [Bacteroidales bacterium]
MRLLRYFISLSLFAFLLTFSFDTFAQDDTSRFEHYRKQYAKLHDNYLRSPEDVANIAALAYFYSEPDNPMRNLSLAMDYIQVSETRYRAMIGDQKRYREVNRLIKRGFTIVGLRQRRQMIVDEARKYVKNGVQPDETEAFMRAFPDDKLIIKELAQQRSVYSYNKAIELNTEKAYKEYLDNPSNTYNRSTIVENLKNLLKGRINACTSEQSIDEILAEYDYPEIKQLAEAQKCEINYRTAVEKNTSEEYIRFLRRFPSSDKYTAVLSALDTLVVKEFYSLTTPRQYADFAQKYSELSISEQARDSLVAMIIDRQDGEALHIYLSEFETDEHYNDVYKAYYLRYAEEGNLAPILLFEKKNPDFPLKFLVEEDKQRAAEIDKISFLQTFTEADVAKYSDFLKKFMGKGINFVLLQRLIQPYLAQSNWKTAIAIMDKNEICFENKQNAKFLELKNILSENVKTKPAAVYSIRGDLSHPFQTRSGKIFANKVSNLGTQIVCIDPQKGKKTTETDVVFDTADGNDITFFGLSNNERTMLVGQNGDIFYATEVKGAWKKKDFEAEGLNTVLHYEGDASFTPDGMGILFVSDRKGGYNVNESGMLFHGDTALATDIYYMPRVGDGWGKPINLGPVVNSAFSERSPVLSKDLTTLYFASDRTGGMGFYDIYMSTRKNNSSWTEWSEPVNIGKVANTGFSETTLSLSPDEETLFYTTYLPATKHYALYSCKTKHSKGHFYSTVFVNCKRISNLSDVKLDIVDMQTNVVEHHYRLSDTITSLKIDVFAKKNYIIRCVADGYYIPLIRVRGGSTAVEPQAFEFRACVSNHTHIPLPTVEFEPGTAKLLPISEVELQQVAAVLKANRNLKVEVISNVSAADAEKAYELSLERSNALKEALSKFYIDPSRVVASGYGNVNFKKNSSVKPVEIVFFEE